MPDWTPGPWTTFGHKHRAWICGVGNNRDDPQVWAERVAEPGEAYVFGDKYADARLIAAAPDLYGALDHLLRAIAADELIPESVSYIKQAREALAKARGELPELKQN